jgi:acetyl esterase
MRAVALEAVHEIFDAAGGVERPAHREVDHTIPVGGLEIAARSYAPDAPGPLPGVLQIHGGAWSLGSIDWPTFRAFSREIAGRVPCVVLDVEYHLAPEFPFPQALEDCYAALVWMTEHASELGVDPSRIAVSGNSAGADLATAACMLARDRGGPMPVAQLLEIPALDHVGLADHASAKEFATGYTLDLEAMLGATHAYFADPEHAKGPLASPLLAEDLSGLPPAHIMTAELDLLRDCGESYGARLREAGVAATVSRRPGHTHGSSLLLHPRWEGARTWRDEVVQVLQGMLAPMRAASAA